MTLTGHSCGDGNLDLVDGEECEGINFNGASCISQGYTGGTLTCNSSCRIDTSNCTAPPAYVSQQYVDQYVLPDGVAGLGTALGTFVSGSRLYVADSSNYQVDVFNVTTHALITTISIPGHSPESGCASPDGTKIIITWGDYGQFSLYSFNSGTGEYTHVGDYGSEGQGFGQMDVVGQCVFDSSSTMAFLTDYTFAVGNTTNHRVWKWNSSTHQFVSSFGSYGNSSGTFHSPAGITRDSSDNLYVSDGTGRIQKFNGSGTVDSNFSLNVGATSYLGVDSNDRIYSISGTLGNSIKVYSHISGSLVGTVNSGGSTTGNISGGIGVAVGSDNSVYANNSGNTVKHYVLP